MSASRPLSPQSLLFCCNARTVEKGQKAKSPAGGVRVGTPGYHHCNRGYHRGPYVERRMYRETIAEQARQFRSVQTGGGRARSEDR